ncbi:hypothetical protein [Sphingobacterium psychroaquaticum]|uniref:Uncharacterized protein n=1 Tax=Sphingobacterium psychroaquaticum TaxID=561061 RepID=A0A1X7HUZ9_9SPHI|nr:hypothetical protein [Sphingobacterium psychroaquaticum]SMG05816.1 hypothetical protein SAMN05660862_0080 [Sphingobacterium psychroaquaticum]
MYANPTDFDATPTINTRKGPDIDVKSTVHAPKRSGGDLLILRATTPRIRNAAKCSRNATKCVRDGAIEYVDAMKTSVAALPISFFTLNILLDSRLYLHAHVWENYHIMNAARSALYVAARITKTRFSSSMAPA